MPPIVIAGALAAGAATAGAVASNKASGRASRTAERAAQRFYDIDDPDYEAMKLKLEELKSQGVLSPEQEEAILQDPSLLQNVAQDPRLAKADMDALATLSSIANSGGMDAQSQLGFEQARGKAEAAARGSREANLLNAAQRGVSGSGLEFTSNQMADQNAANQYSMEGLAKAAEGNKRDLDALGALIGQTNTLSSRDLELQASKAQAQDAINKFNTQTRQGVQSTNVGANNAAQQYNLGEKQRLSDQNTVLRNSQQQYNSNIGQQKFQNDMDRARGAAGLTGAQVAAQTAAGQNLSQSLGGLGQAALGVGGAIYANQSKSPTLTDAEKLKLLQGG
jgi:hypothetical protein